MKPDTSGHSPPHQKKCRWDQMTGPQTGTHANFVPGPLHLRCIMGESGAAVARLSGAMAATSWAQGLACRLHSSRFGRQRLLVEAVPPSTRGAASSARTLPPPH